MVTRTNCPVSFIHTEATACRHRYVSLLRRIFRAWLTVTELRRDCSDSDEDSDGGRSDMGRHSSSLYEGSRTELATIVASDGEEDEEEEDFIRVVAPSSIDYYDGSNIARVSSIEESGEEQAEKVE
jgi:hypothetical protein